MATEKKKKKKRKTNSRNSSRNNRQLHPPHPSEKKGHPPEENKSNAATSFERAKKASKLFRNRKGHDTENQIKSREMREGYNNNNNNNNIREGVERRGKTSKLKE
jgi:hypothetical protein